MDVDKLTSADSWNDLQALQKETELLLQTIRQKPPSKKSNATTADKNANKGKQLSSKKSKTTATNRNDISIENAITPKRRLKAPPATTTASAPITVGNLSVSLDRTQDIFSQSQGRVTVEVLDDASPDTTPRLDVDVRAQRERDLVIQSNLNKVRDAQTSEQSFRSAQFAAEKTRVLSAFDTFVPAPGVTAEDVEREKSRLQRLEESAREQQRLLNSRNADRQAFLGQDKSALHLQRVFRGHLGRQKYSLSRRLQELLSESADGGGDWIEVRDRDTGDTWFYNRRTGESQWDRPDEMFASLSNKAAGSLKALQASAFDEFYNENKNNSSSSSKAMVPKSASSSPVRKTKQELSRGQSSTQMKMSLPSLEATAVSKHSLLMSKSMTFGATGATAADEEAKESQARREIDDILGVSDRRGRHDGTETSLLGPDGRFKPHLRATVMDTLVGSRFDSVSTVLADDRWMETEKDPFKAPHKAFAPTTAVDPLRKPMTAVVRLNEGKELPVHRFSSTANSSGKRDPNTSSATSMVEDFDLHKLESYTVRPMPHPGTDAYDEEKANNTTTNNNSLQPANMCFGCWSAGNRRGCQMHEDPNHRMKPSETMLLCRNWDLSVMKRRYRSEEIQEIFLRKAPSLRYNAKRKAFTTVEEQRHIIYRYYRKVADGYNTKFNLLMKIKRWVVSLADEFRVGKVKRTKAAMEKALMMRMRRTLVNSYSVKKYTKTVLDFMPIGPTTGYSWPERIGEAQYLYTVPNPATGMDVEVILAYPTPKSQSLMLPRAYHLPVPKTIPMPKPEYTRPENLVNVLPANTFIDGFNPAAWFEKLVFGVTKDSVTNAFAQIQAVTPIPGLEKLKRTKHPVPHSIKFATIGRKPTPGLIDKGGLPVELLVYQLVTTFVPAQYGNLMVMDKSSVSPGVSAEVMVNFQSLPAPPVKLDFVLRPLEHPLNYRRSPTIGIHSKILAEDYDARHFYGLNRPEQTGEQEHHGFRTTTGTREMQVTEETDPQTFMPSNEVASLNTPASNLSKTTHADLQYPFCEPSTRDNTTLDFYHMLLFSVVSGSKAQVFTSLTVQEPGKFMMECRDDLPMGHLVASIYRSWAFSQKDVIEEYKTDDGVPYWYHRRTGQTFWERPLYEDEEPSPLLGGTVLDMAHDEEPLTGHAGKEGRVRRYHQGEVRKQMLTHHESDAEAVRRRTAAAASARMARQRGTFPDPVLVPQSGSGEASMTNADRSSNNNDNNNNNNNNKELSTIGEAVAPTDDDDFVSLDASTVSKAYKEKEQQKGSSVSFQPPPGSVSTNHNSNTSLVSAPQTPATASIPGMPGMAGMAGMTGMDAHMMINITEAISKMMTGMMDNARPEDMIQMGLGMGMAMMAQNAMPDFINGVVQGPGDHHSRNSKGVKTIGGLFGADDGSSVGSLGSAGELLDPYGNPITTAQHPSGEPIGVPNRTMLLSNNKPLEHSEERQQAIDQANQAQEELSAVERARKIAVVTKQGPTDTPDVAPKKVLTHELPANAEVGNREKVPVVMYPELSTTVDPMANYQLHPSAGVGTSFVLEKDRERQKMVSGTTGDTALRKTVMPLPVGFFDAITNAHVASQFVDYLPQVPNLPQARTVGRVKPRSTALDWLSISFDPWSAGKNPLNSEFVPSLSTKAEQFFDHDAARSAEQLETLRNSTLAEAFATVDDGEGQGAQRAEITKAQVLATDFKKACTLTRHNKYAELEQLLNQPDWTVPIDYQDEQGNTLLHVAAQNGNRRLAKLCLRRGATLDLPNLQGQTALHYCFGYGYADMGEYLVKRGANDTIRNKDGLTCYEGLGARELAHL